MMRFFSPNEGRLSYLLFPAHVRVCACSSPLRRAVMTQRSPHLLVHTAGMIVTIGNFCVFSGGHQAGFAASTAISMVTHIHTHTHTHGDRWRDWAHSCSHLCFLFFVCCVLSVFSAILWWERRWICLCGRLLLAPLIRRNCSSYSCLLSMESHWDSSSAPYEKGKGKGRDGGERKEAEK